MIDIAEELKTYGIEPVITDPQADADEAERLYGIQLERLDAVRGMDAVIAAVAHKEFLDLQIEDVDGLFGDGRKVLMDIKGIFEREKYKLAGYEYWRL